jgi:hypothetical protein
VGVGMLTLRWRPLGRSQPGRVSRLTLPFLVSAVILLPRRGRLRRGRCRGGRLRGFPLGSLGLRPGTFGLPGGSCMVWLLTPPSIMMLATCLICPMTTVSCGSAS